MSNLPLKGITVLDLSRLIPGPFCSLILSDLGARVIKLEDTDRGDYLREIPPVIDRRGGALYQALNRNKESVVVDLKKKKGKEVFSKLIKRSDVLLESFRPGVMSRLGFSYNKLKKINPKIILASISGFGQRGPNSHRAGHDLNYLSIAGVLSPPENPSIQWSDLVGGGLWGALSILVALYQRKKTKKGTYLDISMTDGMTFLNLGNIVMSQLGTPLNILSGVLARYHVYKTADGEYVSLAALENKFWNRFCDLIGKSGWKSSNNQYLDLSPKVCRELSAIFSKKGIKHWVKLGQKNDICLMPVLNPAEILTSSQFKSRGFFLKSSAGAKNVIFPVTPRFSAGKYQKFKKPPKKGGSTVKILKGLGYSKREIDELRSKQIVRTL